MTAYLPTPLFAEGTRGNEMRIPVSGGHCGGLPKWKGREINCTVVFAEDVDADEYVDKRRNLPRCSCFAVRQLT